MSLRKHDVDYIARCLHRDRPEFSLPTVRRVVCEADAATPPCDYSLPERPDRLDGERDAVVWERARLELKMLAVLAHEEDAGSRRSRRGPAR